ncbi:MULTISPECIES: hypothetical protein [unclassified Nocardioides]|uniref:hypothetical protein n=1 Tax=unclassified Nocardioides TaxID=2615069 RepID=UPI0007034FB4|nr:MULTISPECIES: hypothetical protein [unclassified Nocardioides]KRC46486.1 hypothetical protein ASE19_21950 [Nocardioides sp. Root79]KRC69831.1 hypothetical protein ASE20_14805 [Nocardioides sp. Root240]
MHPTFRHAALATLATACGAATLLPLAPAGAAAPTRIHAEYWGVTCVAGLGGGQTLFLTGGGTTDGAEGGVGAFVEASDGSFVVDGEASSFAFGSTFSATVPLGAKTFAISADAAQGPRTTEAVDERDGNRWTKGTTTVADVLLTGVVATYDGRPVVLGENACTGDINGFDVRTTNPAGYVSRSGDLGSDICDLGGLADGQVRLGGVLPDAYVEVVLDHGTESVEKAQGELRLRAGRGSLRTEVVDLVTEEVRTTATIDVDLQRSGHTVRTVESADGITERRTVTPYLATIEVTLADGRHGRTTCAAASVTSQLQVRPTH